MKELSFTDLMVHVAQAAINMREEQGNTFECGSRTERALAELCERVSDGRVIQVKVGCRHLVDSASLSPVPGERIVDVTCRDCGTAGSVGLDEERVQWEDA